MIQPLANLGVLRHGAVIVERLPVFAVGPRLMPGQILQQFGGDCGRCHLYRSITSDWLRFHHADHAGRRCDGPELEARCSQQGTELRFRAFLASGESDRRWCQF